MLGQMHGHLRQGFGDRCSPARAEVRLFDPRFKFDTSPDSYPDDPASVLDPLIKIPDKFRDDIALLLDCSHDRPK